MGWDDLSGAINSATTSVSNAISSAGSAISSATGAVGEFLSSGPASALSSISNAVSGAISSLGTAFSPVPGIKLPLPNPLFKYATYDYVLGIAVLSNDELNSSSFMSNTANLTLICKTANAEPANRIKTVFGQFDYFVDKLQIESTIGLEKGATTNMQKMEFEIVEPYSMGTFMMTIQEAAWKKGHDNYLQAPFLMTIDFRGNTETGKMDNIPGTARRIPFKFKDVTMTVTELGAVYKCTAYPWSADAHSAHVSELKTDASVKGKTVQEVLQTGEKSLQVVLNKRLQQLKKEKIVEVPDQILILFPVDVSSGPDSSSNKEDNSSATVSVYSGTESSIMQQLKLTKSKDPANDTYVQDPANVNLIGKAKMGFSDTRKADAPVGKDNVVVKDGNVIRGKNTVDPQIGDMRFNQDTDIPTAIDAVLMQSEYATTQLHEQNVDSSGMRKWWRIDTQVFNVSDKSNAATTGTNPRIIVYRVIPYGVHTSKVTAPNTKAPGMDQLAKQCVKVYDYIYTGKNVDVLSFHIEMKTGFAGKMGATSIKRTQDNKQQAQQSGADDNKSTNLNPLNAGAAPEMKPGVIPQKVNYSATKSESDYKGGGGLETEHTRAARQFHDAITSAAGMISLDLKIIGDPYWISQSGTGNYTSTPTQYQNLNKDGTVNYQTSEVDVMVNFRTPVDLNQSTGLYDFGKSTKSAPVLTWSGLYQVTKVTSNFVGGQFTQVLTGPRRNGQEITGPGSTANTLSVSNEKKTPEQEDE